MARLAALARLGVDAEGIAGGLGTDGLAGGVGIDGEEGGGGGGCVDLQLTSALNVIIKIIIFSELFITPSPLFYQNM